MRLNTILMLLLLQFAEMNNTIRVKLKKIALAPHTTDPINAHIQVAPIIPTPPRRKLSSCQIEWHREFSSDKKSSRSEYHFF